MPTVIIGENQPNLPTVYIGIKLPDGKGSKRYSNLLNRYSVERVDKGNVVQLVAHAQGIPNLLLTLKNPSESLAAFDFLTDLLQYDPAIKIDLQLLKDDPVEYIKKINDQLNPAQKEKPISFTIDDLLQ